MGGDGRCGAALDHLPPSGHVSWAQRAAPSTGRLGTWRACQTVQVACRSSEERKRGQASVPTGPKAPGLCWAQVCVLWLQGPLPAAGSLRAQPSSSCSSLSSPGEPGIPHQSGKGVYLCTMGLYCYLCHEAFQILERRS